jgi:hypothetical protein
MGAMDESTGERIKVGDRVRLSHAGMRSARVVDRAGVVLGINKSGTQFRVQWDGSKRGYFLHYTYVEPADRIE